MIDEILRNIWKVEVPLPKNPLKALNSYFIKGEERNLIIDTGMKRKECIEVLEEAVHKLEIDLCKTDFFITHLHADHLGMVTDLATASSIVYFNRPDAETVLDYKNFWENMYRVARRYGIGEEDLRLALDRHPGRIYSPEQYPPFTLLQEKDELIIGDYRLQCIETPGHSPGHICLYEPGKKIFFSGDHILRDITPNISAWRDGLNPLQDYLESLDKVYKLDIEMVFPGHRSVIPDYKQRIRELKDHHQARADEVLAILQNGSKDALTVASQMTWDLDIDSWEHFPIAQKWFGTGEAIAHLKYLEHKGKIYRETHDDRIVFCKRMHT